MLTDQYASRKVIVWAYFQYEIQRLADALAERKVDFAQARIRNARCFHASGEQRTQATDEQISPVAGA